MEVLDIGLEKACNLLRPGGRIAVISYHSLEDRKVKYYFRDLAKSVPMQPGMLPDEVRIPTLKVINRRPIVATEEEIASNSRARSAKLRIAEKLPHAA